MLPRLSMMIVVGLLAMGIGAGSYAAEKPPRPGEEPDDGIQGEYVGTFTPAGQNAAVKADAKVVGEGGGKFRAVLTAGEGAQAIRAELTGKAEGKKVSLAGGEWKGTIEGRETLAAESMQGKADLKFTVRHSPTEGAKPPAGAIVLLPFEEGKATLAEAWVSMKDTPCPWVPQNDGSLLVKGGNIKTKRAFGNVQLHVEFKCPYMPAARGQGRGNSGVYLQSRYEVQVLDSFGLVPQDNDCGGIYKIAVPKEIASLPPAAWQTYDITFHAPEVKDGKITQPATLAVLHNGVKIHENVKIDHVTTAGVGGPIVSPAPLMLQDHGNPVRYRNIWLVELKE